MKYKKDGMTYYFNSKKFPELNNIFGLTKKQKQSVDENLNSQRNYLKNTFVNINDESYISLLDINFSANIKPKQYYGEMFNRVDCIKRFANDIGYDTPVFITLTPPSHLKPLKQIRLKNNVVKLVDNPKFVGFLDDETGEVFDYVSMARDFISSMWTKFLRQYLFREMKAKYGERLIYMRTYEPMLDGTPHVHIVAFIPNEYKERFVKLVKNYFSTRTDVKIDFDEGVGGVVAYILKYILKSFSNSESNELDDVGYWYAFNKIRRFTTSRTLIPMAIYRKIKQHEEYRNLMEMTKKYKMGHFEITVQYDSYKLYSKDFNDINSIDYQIASVAVWCDNGIESHFKILYEKSENVSLYVVNPDEKVSIPKEIVIHKPKETIKQKIIPVAVENSFHKYLLIDGKLSRVVIVPSKMKNFQLYQYYLKIQNDFDVDLVHFGLTQNECIKRGLIDGKIQSLNDFNTKIGA